MLSLLMSMLFFDIDDKKSTISIFSRTSLLFYSVSFFIFMVVAAIPFLVAEQKIVAKEVYNGYYHPVVHHFAKGIARLPGVCILAFITTVIMVTMTEFRSPFLFFVDMFLSLFCSEAIAQLVSLIVSQYIIGIVGLCGVRKLLFAYVCLL